MNDSNKSVAVTLSIGVAMIAPEVESVTEMMGIVDKALYSAKQNGRNQVQYIENDYTYLSNRFDQI